MMNRPQSWIIANEPRCYVAKASLRSELSRNELLWFDVSELAYLQVSLSFSPTPESPCLNPMIV
jgi:hypothetical protein